MKDVEAEYWLRGPLAHIIIYLQPVAHALLQARLEIGETMENFPDFLLWETPAGNASPAFHLQHIAGVLDRLFTYSNNEQLTEQQLSYLSNEGKRNDEITVSLLLDRLDKQIDSSLNFLKKPQAETLTETRYVGRKNIPSTQIGLLFHAAEHTMRHTGQLLVTVKVINERRN